MRHLEAKIVLELDAVHDGEHRCRGGAAHKEHLRGIMLLMMMQSLWMTTKLKMMMMMMPTKLTTMEMRTSTSIRSSGLCRDFLGGKLDKLRKNCQGHLSRWTANKAKSRSWQMEWVWLVDEHLRVEALWAEARSNAAGGLSCELTWDQSDPCESDVDTGYIRDVKTDVSTSYWNCNYRKKAI